MTSARRLGFLLSAARRLVAFGTALLVLRISHPRWRLLDLDAAPWGLAALGRRPLRFVPPTSRVCTPVASLLLLFSDLQADPQASDLHLPRLRGCNCSSRSRLLRHRLLALASVHLPVVRPRPCDARGLRRRLQVAGLVS